MIESPVPHPGLSRTVIARDHALVTPESHVPLALPGFSGADTIVLISAAMGAGFGQYLVQARPAARLQALRASHQYFALVLAGQVALSAAGHRQTLDADGWAYLPPASDWLMESDGPAELLVFEKGYQPRDSGSPPPVKTGHLRDVPAEPFLGDEGALLQTLLDDGADWDWGINVFEFVPGGTLPLVESHFMEHGLYLLGGSGVYRLDDAWYPVQAGDAIWMGPYVTQWYAATGKTPSRYIYYKDMNRAPAV